MSALGHTLDTPPPSYLSTAGSALEPLGIGGLEERLYGIVIDHPGCTTALVVKAAGAPRGSVTRALASLEARGLVSRSAEPPRGFLPAAPDLALEVLLLRRQEDLERVRGSIAQFFDRFRAGARAATTDLVEVITNREGVAQRFRQIQRSVTHELLIFDSPPYAMARDEADNVELALLERGISVRAVYDRDVLDIPGALETIALVVAAGEKARTTLKLPTKLVICDRRLALMPLDLRRPRMDSGILVQESALLEALAALFERVWETASPLDVGRSAPGRTPAGRDIDQEILAMLAAGLTERAIARQLRVSPRTVSRRVEVMMRTLAVQTRFQLATRAIERGWLRADDT